MIPTTIDEAINWLENFYEASPDKSLIDKMSISQFLGTTHMSLGRYMRNTFGLWQDSSLAKEFNAIGINHADDMSGLLLRKWFCEKFNYEFDWDKQVQHYIDYWKNKEVPIGVVSPLEKGERP